MKANKIKKRKEELFKIIKDANIELERLRKVCKHENTFTGLYQWGGPGHWSNSIICEDCGECLKNLDIPDDGWEIAEDND